MGSIAARHARTVLENVERVLALELLVRGPGARLPARARARRGARGRRRRGPRAGSARSSRTSPWTASRGRTSRPRPPSSAAASWRRLAGGRRATAVAAMPDRSDVTDEPAFGLLPAVRRPAVRPPELRLLGGRRPRLAPRPIDRPGARRSRQPDRPTPSRTTTTNRWSTRSCPPPRGPAFNPFAADADEIEANPFAPPPPVRAALAPDTPRKLALLLRGRGIFGSYAKVLLLDDAADRLRAVRAAVRLPARLTRPRAVPAAARCAAAGGHHLHRDDERCARGRPRQAPRRGGLRRPGRPRVRRGRDVPGGRPRP